MKFLAKLHTSSIFFFAMSQIKLDIIYRYKKTLKYILRGICGRIRREIIMRTFISWFLFGIFEVFFQERGIQSFFFFITPALQFPAWIVKRFLKDFFEDLDIFFPAKALKEFFKAYKKEPPVKRNNGRLCYFPYILSHHYRYLQKQILSFSDPMMLKM